MVLMGLVVLGLTEVNLAEEELWINPLFEKLSMSAVSGMGPFAKLSDGSLMIVRRNAMRISKDDGQTWSEPRTIYEGDKPGIPGRGQVLKTHDGVIVLVYADSSTSRWEWDESKGEPKQEPRRDIWTIRSLDDGKTWVDRQMIFRGYCGSNVDIIQTESGHIVMPLTVYVSNPVHYVTCTYVSADNGKTWRRSNLIDMGGVGGHDGALEATLVELKDGRLYMLMRTAWDRFWEAYSWDKGLTWRHIQPSNIPTSSSPGYITRLSSGRLALAWSSPLPGGEPRPLAEVLSIPPPLKGGERFYVPVNLSLGTKQISIMFSEDEAKTWTKPIVIARELRPDKGLRYVYLFEHEPGLLWIFSSRDFQSVLQVSVREADLLED